MRTDEAGSQVMEGLYQAEGMIDKNQPEMSEHVERGIRRRLIEEIQPLLFSGKRLTIKIEREEREPDKTVSWAPQGMKKVRYRADIGAVRVKDCSVMNFGEPLRQTEKRHKTLKECIRAAVWKIRGRRK